MQKKCQLERLYSIFCKLYTTGCVYLINNPTFTFKMKIDISNLSNSIGFYVDFLRMFTTK